MNTVEEMITERVLRWAGHVARMRRGRLPRALLTGWVAAPRPTGRPEQTFGHALNNALKLRADQIRAAGPTVMYAELGTKYYFHAGELADSLERTRTLKKTERERRWIDEAQNRGLWSAIVYKNFYLR